MQLLSWLLNVVSPSNDDVKMYAEQCLDQNKLCKDIEKRFHIFECLLKRQ